MTRAWCVRADCGTSTAAFRPGGFAAVGWNDLGDLSRVTPCHVMAR
jgi:hypothetical protein